MACLSFLLLSILCPPALSTYSSAKPSIAFLHYKISQELDNLSSQLLKGKSPGTNYFHTLDKFYDTSPYKVMSDCRNLTSYAEIYKQARLDLDMQLIPNRLNTFKSIIY